MNDEIFVIDAYELARKTETEKKGKSDSNENKIVYKATEKIDEAKRKLKTRFSIKLILDLDLTSINHANELIELY